ncbi:hypothetical protein [Pararobbsia alpina]|uniref:Uncharacterized protein n=1 Tax=Pararobbsia alpina TaxID=621374 RepID=A0A6S7C9V3_9BURK|nr:hypothetical protein [Pararobbsia alpina]CAB3784583.1 hypothetical protein LMG28138_01838 [Pararobbsia alpina]
MKPFDLEAVKRGEPLVTRKGKAAKFIVHVPECDPAYRVIALVEGQHLTNSYYEDGRIGRPGDSDIDLFMAPKKRTVYVNVYGNRNDLDSGPKLGGFDTEDLARENSIGTVFRVVAVAVPIEIED